MILPDCMWTPQGPMPDGAEPCKGFLETAAERDRLKAVNAELLAALRKRKRRLGNLLEQNGASNLHKGSKAVKTARAALAKSKEMSQ